MSNHKRFTYLDLYRKYTSPKRVLTSKLAAVLLTTSLFQAQAAQAGTVALPTRSLASPYTSHVQVQKVTGVVTDASTGDALPGVTVLVEGTTTGTATGIDGEFQIPVSNPNATLVFSFIGYQTQKVPLNGRTAVTVQLGTDAQALEEVVVVGYGTIKKSDLTGAVSTVETEEIQQVATVDVNQALQGKVAGVQITPSSGAPGTGAKVRIRGIGSFGASDPLYVVDGYPVGSIDFLSPNDIASMEVLKDASATAVYGNRGANGVIIVTTKQGKEGKPTFNFNMYAGIQNPWNKLDLTNAAEYSELYLEAYTNDGIDVTDPNQFNATNYAILKNAIDNNLEGTDWQKAITNRNAPIQNYNFSVSGGSENSRYNVSATYFNQEGTVLNTGMEKFLIRANNDYTFNSIFKGGWSLNYVNANFNNYQINQYSGVLPTATVTSPLTPAWDPVTNNYGEATRFSTGFNPLRLANETENLTTQQNRVVATVYGEAELTDGLTFRSTFGGDVNFNKIREYWPEFVINANERRTQSSLYDERQNGWQWTWSNVLNYTKDFGEHRINAMLGQEAQTQFADYVNVTGYNILNDPTQFYVGAAKQTAFQAGSFAEESSLFSVFGRLNYSYQGKYLLTATLRRDASSKFIPENRVGYFPSFSLGWNVVEESFLQDVTWLSNLKLRAGYGVVGNQNILSATSTSYVVQPQQRYVFGGEPVEGRANTTLRNEDLVWEASTMTNFGVDAGFLNNKLNLSLEYFDKRTRDLLVTVPIPSYIGALAPVANAGDMLNRGFEAALNYRQSEGDFRYDLGVNASFIQNEVLNLGGGEAFTAANVDRLGNVTRFKEGEEFAYFYGRKTDGIFNSPEEVASYVYTNPETGETNLIQPNAQPGDVKFVDLNGDGMINDQDRTKLGSAMPDFTYGFNAFMEYKNFDLKIFFQGVYGNETVNAMSVFTENPQGIFNSYSSRLDRWTPENPNTDEPRMTATDPNVNITFSDRYVEDGSYLRLRNIQLGYTLPESLTSRVGVKGLRVYVSSDNLLTFTKYTGYEPEVGDLWNNPFYYGVDMATYPQARTFIGGLNVTF
ncbi:TonB-linked SusC/RagA family outer membrane protein [Pontibacter ummariensis]|uniref:TonB-linked outer membrane protein, SusC/RagA family n=1 Tax=Pontibacter ummariensis TaxID=1610492 RepID=A0A239ICA4_9BACT|nr:TonB-dependent receptor [Pontibacter ummariensis]PRY09945.1 TonB-linked SusC/RagA family outer membrane protein [Pontibacter ummariensis]SNS90898.1 TonB-linked outer membrane protein, SusC/RagA family [Pontibacter ummariensis]